MNRCSHWNVTIMLKADEVKHCHEFRDGAYYETYTVRSTPEEKDVEAWCDDCETFWSWEKDEVPAWCWKKLVEVEAKKLDENPSFPHH